MHTSTLKPILAALTACVATAAVGQTVPISEEPAAQPRQVVEVVAAREYDFFTDYKAIFAGLRAIQETQAELAPDDALKFFVEPIRTNGHIRVSILGLNQELEVMSGEASPFQFPLNEELASESARVVVAGGGPKPIVTISVQSPLLSTGQWRLGDARLLCTFLTAARKEAATGMNWLTFGLFGSFTCQLPIPVNPAEYQVIAYRKNSKETALSLRNGLYYFPTNLSIYANESLIEARPLRKAKSAP